MEDEYELIPMSPIRRLEKRMEKMEKSGASSDTSRELIEIVRANQHVIDDMVKMNAEMMNRVGDLLVSVNTMTNKITDFMNRLEVTTVEEEGEGSEAKKEVDDRLVKLEKRLNALILSSMAKKRAAAQI